MSCAISRADADTIYFGGDFSVYRASAADGDWDEITSGMSPGMSHAVALDLPKLWVLNDYRTFHESTNGGASWTTVWYSATLTHERIKITVDPDDDNGDYTIYSSYFDNTCPESPNSHQIHKSTDTGRTWVGVYNPQGDGGVVQCIVVDIASANNATIYATYTHKPNVPVIIKSTDSGESWTSFTSGLPSGKDVYCLAIKPTNNDTLYAGLKDNGVYIHTNAVAEWYSSGLSTGTVKALAIDPSNTDVIYAGTTSGIYKSTNGGSSWTYKSGPTNNNFVDLLIHPDVTSVIYATCVDSQGNGYVYVSLNAGSSWLDITGGLPDGWIMTRFGLYFADLQIDPEQTDSLFLGTTEGLYYLNTNLYHGTVSSGMVSWDDDWIFVPGDFTIGANATLNVAAGTKVYVAPNYDCEAGGAEDGKTELIVDGTINVSGTSGSPVEFLPGPGSTANLWRGIHLQKDSDGDFDYAEIKYGYRAVQADTCQSLAIDDCEFTSHDNAGVVILEPPSGTNLSDCDFDACGDYGIRLDGGSPTIRGNDLEDCQYGIYYTGNSDPIIRKNTLWIEILGIQDPPYYGVYIKANTGTNSPTVDSCKISGYSIYGLYMKNADASATVSAVTCSSNTNGMRLDSASPDMSCQSGEFNSITWNDSLGLVMTGSSSPVMRYNKIKHNDKRGVHIGGTSNPDLDPGGAGADGRNSLCYYDDNDPEISTMLGWYYDLYNNTQNTIDAEGCWWGDSTNYWDGTDPYIHTTQNVDFRPRAASDPLSGYGGSWRIGVPDVSLPLAYHLGQNYPNPFNAVTRIPYSVGSAGYVSLRIYNLRGRLVHSLVDSHVQAGEHLVRWDGRDGRGQAVSTGIYFYRLEAESYSQTRKLILLK